MSDSNRDPIIYDRTEPLIRWDSERSEGQARSLRGCFDLLLESCITWTAINLWGRHRKPETNLYPLLRSNMLTRVDRELLVALLINGDNSRANLSEMIDRHPNSISDSRDRLEDEGLIHDKGSGVLALSLSGVRAAQAVNRSTETDLNPQYAIEDMLPDGTQSEADSEDSDSI